MKTQRTLTRLALALVGALALLFVLLRSEGEADSGPALERTLPGGTDRDAGEIALAEAHCAEPDSQGRSSANVLDLDEPVDPTETEPAADAPCLVAIARIVDGQGTPMEGASLTAVDLEAPVTAITGPEGKVRLEIDWPMRLREGNPAWCVVEASAPGRTRRREQRRISGPEVVRFGDLVLEPAGAVTGRVMDADGAPLSLAVVYPVGAAEPASPEIEEQRALRGRAFPPLGGSGGIAQTDEEGHYRFDSLPARALTIVAGARGHAFSYTPPFDVPAGTVIQAPPIVLARLDVGSGISGVVVDDRGVVPNAMVEAFENRGGRNVNPLAGPARTDAQGRFRLRAPPGGPFTLEVAHADEARPFVLVHDVSPGDAEIRVEFPPVRILTVRALAASDSPLEQLKVRLIERPMGYSITLPRGRSGDGALLFACPNVPFQVEARARGYRRATAGPFEPETATDEIVVRLTPAAALRGTVTASGTPVSSARVHVHSRPRHSATERFDDGLRTAWGTVHRGAPRATTDRDGQFELFVDSDGPFLVHVDADGHARGEAGPIQLDPRGPGAATSLAIALPQGAGLMGRMLVAEGVDVGGATVAITHADGHVHLAETDEQGAYRFEHLTPGSWQVRRGTLDNLEWLRMSRTYPDPDDAPGIRADVELVDGVTTTYDLDFTHEVPCTVTGWLTVDGGWESGWRARLTQGELYASGIVGPDGRFRLHFLGSDEAQLSFFSTSPTGEWRRLDRGVELSQGASEVRWSSLTGSVTVTDLPEPAKSSSGAREFDYALVREGNDGWTWSVRFNANASGEWTFAGVPSGPVELRRRRHARDREIDRWPVVGSFDIIAGERSEFTVPPR